MLIFAHFIFIGGCLIDKIPNNGWIEESDPPNNKLENGLSVNNFIAVRYKCLDNHFVFGPATNFCAQDKWILPVPDCKPYTKKCSPKAISGISIIANRCMLNELDVQCTEPAEPGTVAYISCRYLYERQNGTKQQIVLCGDDGNWTPTPTRCSQICGELPSTGTPYTIAETKSLITQAPWHVGLYKYNGESYELQCGATIVNARVVISAMQCFWDRSENKPYDVSIFRVAAGKEKFGYDILETKPIQKFEVERIFYDPSYNDYNGNYVADLVLIILRTSIKFQQHISPICIPYGLKFDERIVQPGLHGKLVGWGTTKAHPEISLLLKIIDLISVDRSTCLAESNPKIHPLITVDKFCADHFNLNVTAGQ